MKKILLRLLLIVLSFSCAEKGSKEIYQGKLEDFVSGEFVFEKDSATKRITLQKLVEYSGEKFFLSKEGKGYSLFSASSGVRSHSFAIPDEGPLSLKGYIIAAQGFDDGEFVAISSLGNVKKYVDGEQQAEIDLEWSDYEELYLIQMSDQKDNFRKIGEGHYLVTNNPVSPFAENYVDVNYGKWIAEFDLQNGWICTSDFTSGLGEEYSNSSSAAHLVSVYNSDRDEYYVMFSPSDSLYQIKNCEVVKKLKLTSQTKLDYLPGIYEKNGGRKSWRGNPKSAANVALTYDPWNGLYLRMIKVLTEESQPEVTDIKLRAGLNKNTYKLVVYNLDWELVSELGIIYDVGQSYGGILATRDGLLVTKPEQTSEDEYEFYKIDLSQFAD